MSDSWFIYATVSQAAALKAVEATYETLGRIVGKDLAEHLERGEQLEPPVLGAWPDISVTEPGSVPTAAEARASATDAAKGKSSIEAPALTRLAKCVSSIRIDGPEGFDPALVDSLRALIENVGPCVFTDAPGSQLSTSESLLAKLAGSPDLASTLESLGLDDDEDDLDNEEEPEDEEEDDEPASDSAKPEVLRLLLAEIAQHPRARRKAGDLLAEAPEIVGKFAERLARIGAEPDPAVAKALDVKEREVLGARKALATILRRAETR